MPSGRISSPRFGLTDRPDLIPPGVPHVSLLLRDMGLCPQFFHTLCDEQPLPQILERAI
jgi:hypothetical protein